MVPAAAIVLFAGIDRVFVLTDGKASEKRVRTGKRADENIEIVEGIKQGDEVILSPGNMADGDKVIVP